MFKYFARFYEKFDLPIYPVVIYSFDSPRKLQPGKHQIDFPGFIVNRFQFRVIQLNRLKWRDYLATPNPAAAALLSKMQIARRDRVKVKLQCLRLIATLRLDPARSQLISGFVRTYLQMTRPELVELQREVGLLPREEQTTMITLTNEWIELGEERGEERGIEKGIAKGIMEGIEKGRTEGLTEGRATEARSLILRLGTKRFGAASAESEAVLAAADIVRLEAIVDRLLEVESWQELLAE